MPYIQQHERPQFDGVLDGLGSFSGPGQLNYVLSQVIDDYIRENGLSYVTVNDAVGVLECLKMELYRRIVAPYEDKKIEANGDVFTV